jgi:hypothetical protein
MVGNSIREVLQKISNVLLAFQDARPKVFIRRNDKKVLGVLQLLEDLFWSSVKFAGAQPR